MSIRSASAAWEGTIKDGQGTVRLGSGAFEGSYSFASRFEQGTGTNPEELLGAAHAGCFSMALAHGLGAAGHRPERIATTARVHLDKADAGFRIATIELDTEGTVPGLDQAKFLEFAEDAKNNCPVSRLFAGAEIRLRAALK
jgi:osmotically inducible protein OsmC